MSVVHFSKDTFDTEALGAAGPVLVDFWAPWCGPCKMLGPIIEQLGDEMDGKAVIGKVDIDEEPDLAARYGVMSIPTVILFKDGKEVERKVGVMPAQAYTQMLDAAL